jgi:hypothetical protein
LQGFEHVCQLWRTPPPLGALCAANEVADATEAGPGVELFSNAKRWLPKKSSAAISCFEPSRSPETL